jgi:hypothetical protein
VPEPVGDAAIGILSRAFPENVTAASKELRRRNRDAVLIPRLQDDAAVEKRLSRNEAVIDANACFPVAIDDGVCVRMTRCHDSSSCLLTVSAAKHRS